MKKILTLLLALLFIFPLAKAQNMEQKAKSGNVEAMFNLAKAYYNGVGQVQSYKNALKWFEKAANKNHIESMYRTAIMYEKGQATQQNLRKAFDLYMLAAQKGHYPSQLLVAQKFEKGEGTSQSDARAYLWYRVCADRGESIALRKMGDYFRDGKVVTKDHSQAKYWYEKAVEKNDTMSKASLAYLYIANEGLAPNYAKEKELNQEPLAVQIPLAYYNQGMILLSDSTHLDQAVTYLYKAHKAGITQADYPLAKLYYYGRGTEKDVDKACALFVNLPSKYNYESYFLMGESYANGDGEKQDYDKTLRLYKVTAEANNPYACYAIADMYAHGTGVKENFATARVWLDKADKLLETNK